jgi:hypothetical protein
LREEAGAAKHAAARGVIATEVVMSTPMAEARLATLNRELAQLRSDLTAFIAERSRIQRMALTVCLG